MPTFNMSSVKRIAKAVKRVEQTAWDLTGKPRARSVTGNSTTITENRLTYFCKITGATGVPNTYQVEVYDDVALTVRTTTDPFSSGTGILMYANLVYPYTTIPVGTVVVATVGEAPVLTVEEEEE